MLANRFGQFDPSGRTFRITDPCTPMPWVNVISNGRYGLVISQNGGGFSFYDDAQHNVLTRWEMDLVRDCSGKFLYLSDRESGDTWSVAPAPCGTKHDHYECAHTIGATTFNTSAHGISAAWTIAVAEGDGVEVWTLELKNTGARARALRVASFFEWCCGVAPDVKREFHRLFFTTKHDGARRAIVATKNMWDIPRKSEREHWNVPWPYVAAHAVSVEGGAFERDLAVGDKQTFLGKYGSVAAPLAMRGAIPEDGRFGRFGDAAAALGGDFTLAPGATIRIRFLIAVSASEAETLSLIDRYSAPGAATGAVEGSLRAWSERLAPTSIESERPDFDLLNNDWLPYQALSGRLFGRTGYYQQSGAFGFRDQLQDSQVWLPLDPAGTARQIMLHAERQFADGSVYHWWHALANFGNHTACSDDYLWLPFVVANYLRETEDYAILDRRAPFVDDAAGGTIKEHCTRALARAFRRTSARGIPYIGSCDWNDGLSAMGVAERGESVWLAIFLCQVLSDWGAVLARTGDSAGALDCAARRERYADAVNAVAWDGAWYRYGTKDSGAWVGASACAEGKIHLNAQTWSIISGIAPRERATRAWASVKEHLLSPYGPLLLAPAYTTPDIDLGYITRYSPGSRENGGVYMHAATWALMAACMMREGNTVEQVWDSIAPPTRGQAAERYWAEPYVTPGNVDGPLSDLPGRAGWTWYTGSAAWLNRVSLEWVLGIRPVWTSEGAGLCIDPCPPASLGKVSVTRTWRGVRIRVGFDARECAAAGSGARPVLHVNGREIDGRVIEAGQLTAEARRSGLSVTVRWEAATGATLKEPKMGGAAAPSTAVGPRRSVQ
ncbi:MAG: GH36-type glycosyl hydrolase domain-containing protein [Phycisphaerales bacterium]